LTFNKDEVNLTQFKGTPMQDASALASQKMPKSVPGMSSGNDNATDWYIDNYTRPTTVAIDRGTTVLDLIVLDTIGWKYEVNFVKVDEIPAASYGARHDQDCNSGKFRAYAFSAVWDPSIGIGKTHPDAAVQLLNGADVCVKGSVRDTTGFIDKKASSDRAAAPPNTNVQTNALIVWPTVDRATLRVKGNFRANMYHEPAATSTSAQYTTANFPDPATDIYMYRGVSAYGIGTSMLDYNQFTVPFHNYSAVTKTVKPYTSTLHSIFGVYGDYQKSGNMAKLHTDSTTFNNSSMGVLEVGPATDGKAYFHVYGNGMLKNFEGCTVNANFPMEFGQGGVSAYSANGHGGTPEFKINTNDTLYIVNFGNNGTNPCAAKLQFHTTSVDSINEAFGRHGGTGKGALQIQALNNVEFNADATWNNTTNGNNIYVLSDAGNIVAQKLTINSDNSGTDPGHGLINFMTAGRTDINGACISPGTRNKDNGNIYLNDEFKIERAQTASTQTNFIARNNIRTAKFTSTHLNEDTTNIISRDGDIYLGYSAGSNVYNASDAYVASTTTAGNTNDFKYDANASTKDGQLNIMAGWDDSHPAMTHTEGMEGGNVYFTRIITDLKDSQKHNTTIAIPYSSEYICDVREDLYKRSGESMVKYEHSGIIGGLGRCGEETTAGWTKYAGALDNPGTLAALNSMAVNDRSLKYKGNEGNLIVDAGKRGNIILNKGAKIEFQDKTGNATFRTREGDIDMRDVFDAETMKGSLLFLAQLENFSKLSDIGVCGCDEMRNNVYLQDFKYTATGNSGSVFVGADNNIKLNYGGLTNIGTRQDPFLSTDYETYPNGAVKKIGPWL
jgi:hypothetical protein